MMLDQKGWRCWFLVVVGELRGGIVVRLYVVFGWVWGVVVCRCVLLQVVVVG